MSHTCADVRSARIAAGMTQAACAARFGMTLRVWQRKEAEGATGTALTPGEYELLLLIGDGHPELSLVSKPQNTVTKITLAS